jgi:hypothetical protein
MYFISILYNHDTPTQTLIINLLKYSTLKLNVLTYNQVIFKQIIIIINSRSNRIVKYLVIHYFTNVIKI